MTRTLLLLPLLAALAGSGCAMGRPAVAVSGNNPIFVAANNEEAVWERTVDVLHDYFEIARENRIVGSQPGVIETQYKVGATALEPWHRDSIGLHDRLESSLQSIRRKAIVNVTPSEGGYFIAVEVFKELEDVPSTAGNTAGNATFQQSNPLRRDLDLVNAQSAPSGWLLKGRDELLEQDIVRRLQWAFSR